PISTISVSTEVLKDPEIVHQPERLFNYMTIIEKENTRLKQQVERVLQMARLDKEDIGSKKENLSIHHIIQDSLRHTSVALQEKKGNVGLELSADEPAIEGD